MRAALAFGSKHGGHQVARHRGSATDSGHMILRAGMAAAPTEYGEKYARSSEVQAEHRSARRLTTSGLICQKALLEGARGVSASVAEAPRVQLELKPSDVLTDAATKKCGVRLARAATRRLKAGQVKRRGEGERVEEKRFVQCREGAAVWLPRRRGLFSWRFGAMKSARRGDRRARHTLANECVFEQRSPQLRDAVMDATPPGSPRAAGVAQFRVVMRLGGVVATGQHAGHAAELRLAGEWYIGLVRRGSALGA